MVIAALVLCTELICGEEALEIKDLKTGFSFRKIRSELQLLSDMDLASAYLGEMLPDLEKALRITGIHGNAMDSYLKEPVHHPACIKDQFKWLENIFLTG
jgi:hypothetical protein